MHDLEPSDAGHLLRILQEAVGNAMRHANAERVTLSADRDGSGAVLCVADDGSGGAATRRGGRGLANMHRRARELGGELAIESDAEGTRVVLRLPGRRGPDPPTPRS